VAFVQKSGWNEILRAVGKPSPPAGSSQNSIIFAQPQILRIFVIYFYRQQKQNDTPSKFISHWYDFPICKTAKYVRFRYIPILVVPPCPPAACAAVPHGLSLLFMQNITAV